MEPRWKAVRPYVVKVDSDRESMEQLRGEDFEVFYRRSWNAVFRPVASTLGDYELAVEAVDEAMARAYAKWRSVSQMTNAQGWVYRVAYRWGVDRLRRRSRERKLLPSVADSPSAHEGHVEPRLSSALDSLPLEQRAVVVLACAFDWSESEIADALGVRPGTVKSRLHRGLERLRTELGT